MPASVVRVAPGERIGRGERGRTLEAIGGTILAFDVLVLFLLPAGISLGQAVQFLGLVIMLALLGPCSWWAATWQTSPEPRVTSTDNQERKIVS